jgi:hypothetical protein
MQSVQTSARFTCPSNFARTRCKFGRQERLLLLLAWLTLLPTDRPFPQIEQTLAILVSYPFDYFRGRESR